MDVVDEISQFFTNDQMTCTMIDNFIEDILPTIIDQIPCDERASIVFKQCIIKLDPVALAHLNGVLRHLQIDMNDDANFSNAMGLLFQYYLGVWKDLDDCQKMDLYQQAQYAFRVASNSKQKSNLQKINLLDIIEQCLSVYETKAPTYNNYTDRKLNKKLCIIL